MAGDDSNRASRRPVRRIVAFSKREQTEQRWRPHARQIEDHTDYPLGSSAGSGSTPYNAPFFLLTRNGRIGRVEQLDQNMSNAKATIADFKRRLPDEPDVQAIQKE